MRIQSIIILICLTLSTGCYGNKTQNNSHSSLQSGCNSLISTEIKGLGSSMESMMYFVLEVDFLNRGNIDCRIYEYKIIWRDGSTVIKPDHFLLQENETVKRTARIYEYTKCLYKLYDDYNKYLKKKYGNNFIPEKSDVLDFFDEKDLKVVVTKSHCK